MGAARVLCRGRASSLPCFGAVTFWPAIKLGCELSIWSDFWVKWRAEFTAEDDSILLSRMLGALPADELKLFESECDVADSLRAEHGMKPDFDQICERAIMERFAEEEAACAARGVIDAVKP